MRLGKKKADKQKRSRRVRERNAVSSRKTRVVVTILIGVVLALPPLYVNDVFGYAPLFTYLLLILLSYIYMKLLERNLVFEESSTFTTCERGTANTFSIEVRNTSILLFPRVSVCFFLSDLFDNTDKETYQIISLGPKAKRSFDFDISFQHIGLYRAGLKDVSISDLFGFFHKTIPNRESSYIEVTPKVFNIETLELSKETMQESKTSVVSSFSDGMDYYGVREYVIGDPMKTIHWKLSAVHAKQFTRLYETLGNPGVATIINFNAPEYDSESLMSIFDALVETGLSIMLYSQEHAMDTSLMFQNEEKLCVFNTIERSDLISLVREMPRVFTGEDYSVEHVIELEANSLESKTNVAVVTAKLDRDLIESIITLKSRHRNPILFVVVPPHMDPEEKKEFLKPLQELSSAGIAYTVLDQAQQLETEVIG